MAAYDQELLEAARRLLARREGQRGKLPAARIRRSISTSYYAIFHFLLDESGRLLLGVRNDLLRRRRVFARQFTHGGIRLALDKVRGPNAHTSVQDFLRQPAVAAHGAVPSPNFVRNLAKAFLDAQSKRYDADYDMNEPLSEADARLLEERVSRAIRDWRGARADADRDFKHALCMLMILKGQLRSET